ncbi:MAG TPA: hypothetical protein VN973_06945 [Candidatus Dormibacteraeota bacterium]|nr:hypothetical protein [Candidatus Dormibacteraeota bacterium]
MMPRLRGGIFRNGRYCDERTSTIPVVMVTSCHEERDLVESATTSWPPDP